MSDEKLTVLGIAAAASIVLAVFVWQVGHKMKPAPTGQGNLVQGLNPAAIAEIAAGPLGAGIRRDAFASQQEGNEQISLKRRGNGFVVANKSYYPASNRAINDLLAACLDIRTVELYTKDKANYKDLGVSEEDAKDVVKFLDSNGKIITGIIIGNTREDGSTAYGRLIGDDKVYVIYNAPWVKDSPLDYIDTELISINKADIDTVTVTSPKEIYTLTSEANGTEVVLKELPAGKKEKKNESLAVLDALTNLRFDDVNAAAENPNLNFDRQYQCLLKDSTLYTIQVAQKDSSTFIKCGAEFTDKTPVKKEETVESQEELKKKEAKLLAKEKASKFGNACEGWIYQIPEYKAKNLTKPLAELVEDIATEPNNANTPQEKKLTTNKHEFNGNTDYIEIKR